MRDTVPAKQIPPVSADADPSSIAGGAGAAAVLAAGIGSFLMGLFAVIADKSASIKSLMIFSRPTGPLSGVTTSAIVAWLVAWVVLHARWRGKNVALRSIGTAALVLLALGFLLMFPPLADLF